jgi:hypothetical protein
MASGQDVCGIVFLTSRNHKEAKLAEMFGGDEEG